MKEKVQSALDNYVLAYKNNDKELFRSLWDDKAIFEDPVGAEPCNGIEAICAFWDESSISQPSDVNSIDINVDDFKDRG